MLALAPPTFITGNPAKAEQLSWHLGVKLKHVALDVPEIQSLDPLEVVRYKVESAYKIVAAPVLVEDVSLIFESLGKLPGPLIKWFLQELDNHGLCRLLDGYDSRAAIASVIFAYYDGSHLQTFFGSASGEIAAYPRGEKGFGWDPIFIPAGATKTWGEMSKEEQVQTSIRRSALRELEQYLHAL